MRYCSQCGHEVSLQIPAGDNRSRHVCTNHHCQYIHYQNPRLVAGVLPFYRQQILLCKRAIEPRRGYWTLPAGFLENGESVLQGACREAYEEAGLKLDSAIPYRAYDLTHINQVYIMFLAELEQPEYSVGEESLEVRLFAYEDIPWDQLAFPIMGQLIKTWLNDVEQQQVSAFAFEAPSMSLQQQLKKKSNKQSEE